MEIKQLLRKEKKELEKDLLEKKEELRQLRFDLASGKVKNIKDVRRIKKEIAVILTVINGK